MIHFTYTSSIALLALSCTACAQAQHAPAYVFDEDQSFVERIYHYERSNIDGSMMEYISTYRSSVTEVEVFKRTAACTQAALVTAELDLTSFSTEIVTGGQLQPDGTQFPFAFLERDQESGILEVNVELPQTTLNFETPTQNSHFTVYDFDFADLNMVLPYLAEPEGGFATEMVLLWTDPNDPGVRNLGIMTAVYEGHETHLGAEAIRYSIQADVLEGDQGTVWIDASEGYILEAVIPHPNHFGYTDLRLKLTGIEYGEDTWHDLLLSHFENCEQ